MNNERIDPFILVGASIPFLQYELNSRGFHVNVGQGPLPFSLFALIVTDSGLGKSSLWRILQEVRTVSSSLPDASLEHEGLLELDGSTAGLMESLEGRYDSRRDITPALLSSDEIGSMLANAGHKHGKAADTFSYLNTMLVGDTKQEVLRDKTRKVTNPRLSGCGFMTSASLGLLTEEIVIAGFFARMSIFHVKSNRMAPFYGDRAPRNAKQMTPSIDAYSQWLNTLDLWQSDARFTISDCPETQAHLRKFYNKYDKVYGDAAAPVKPYLNRAVEKVLGVAGLFATLRASRCIELEDAIPAVAFVEHSIASFRELLDGHDFLGGGVSERSREQSGSAKAALDLLALVGEEGLSPGQFVAGNRPKAAKGSGIGRVGGTVAEIVRLLEPFTEGEKPPVVCVEAQQWQRIKSLRAGKTSVAGRPTDRYFSADKLPEDVRKFLEEGAVDLTGNVTPIGSRLAYETHMQRWEELGWERVGKATWKACLAEAEESPQSLFEARDARGDKLGEQRKWPFALKGSFARKAQDPRD